MNATGKQRALFYGWWIVGACFLINFYTGGVVFFGFTAVMEPIADELGWSYAQISLAASLRGLETGLAAPVLGLVVNRWGPRRLIFGGALLTGLGFILLSRVNSLGMFYGAFIIIAIGKSTLSSTVLLTAVVNWFRRRVATATGIVASGFAAGGLFVPLVTVLIDKYDWRTAMAVVGLGIWGIAIPLSLVVRHKPEQYGYLPDGDMAPRAANIAPTSAPGYGAGGPTREGAAGAVFWHIALAYVCHMFVISAAVTHLMPYFASIRFARSTASLLVGTLGLVSFGGRIGFGWVGDRFDKRGVTAASFLLMSLGMLIYAFLASGWTGLVVPFIIVFGIGWGGAATMRGALLGEYFGRRRFGMMYGFVVGLAMLGNFAGAPVAGWVFDQWGSYQGMWFGLSALCLVAMILALTMPRFKGRVRLGGTPDAQHDLV